MLYLYNFISSIVNYPYYSFVAEAVTASLLLAAWMVHFFLKKSESRKQLFLYFLIDIIAVALAPAALMVIGVGVALGGAPDQSWHLVINVGIVGMAFTMLCAAIGSLFVFAGKASIGGKILLAPIGYAVFWFLGFIVLPSIFK